MTPEWGKLYEMQDWALSLIGRVEHGFYLTGGTALSRGYYQHRYSEDLDFFANDRQEFELWRDRCLDALMRNVEPGVKVEILLREARFGRAVVHGNVDLKVEFVNDVPFRVGTPVRHPQMGMLDTRENILANKITALLDRAAPKDVADIYWLCCRDNLSIEEAIRLADGKAAGVFQPLVGKRLMEMASKGVPSVYWIDPPSEDDYRARLTALAESLLEF